MKKNYKTDFGSLVFIGLNILIFVSLFSFVFSEAGLLMRIAITILVFVLVIFFFHMLKYKVAIDEEGITASMLFLSFFNKCRTVKFNEIQRIYNEILPFPEMTNIVLVSKNKSTKPIRIMVGFGLPWDVLLDILEHIPKDVRIDFEPFLWKIIKNPITNKRAKKINLTIGVIIILIIAWFLFFLYSVIILHRVVFPINYFIGQ